MKNINYFLENFLGYSKKKDKNKMSKNKICDELFSKKMYFLNLHHNALKRKIRSYFLLPTFFNIDFSKYLGDFYVSLIYPQYAYSEIS